MLKNPPMMPIRKLLDRIRWDAEFGKASFELGILDHVQQRIVRIPFARIRVEDEQHFFFQVEGDTGEILTIPLHRIREVYRDGVLIWQRAS